MYFYWFKKLFDLFLAKLSQQGFKLVAITSKKND